MYNRDQLNAIKAELRKRGITYNDLGLRFRCTAGWVSTCLNGHYPRYFCGDDGKALLPAYMERHFRQLRILPEAQNA